MPLGELSPLIEAIRRKRDDDEWRRTRPLDSERVEARGRAMTHYEEATWPLVPQHQAELDRLRKRAAEWPAYADLPEGD